MEKASYLDHLRADAAALAAAARQAPDAAIPSCPGWRMDDLVKHTGQVHQWVEVTVRTRATERVNRRELAGLPDPPERLGAFEAGAQHLVTALDGLDPDEPVWNWTAEPGAGSFWLRRMAQETAVHRADAELGAGLSPTIDGELAVDGLDELLLVMLPQFQRGAETPIDIGGSLHLHATDRDGEWLVDTSGTQVTVEKAHGKGDAAVRGTASDLYLWACNRVPLATLEVFGDATIAERWATAVQF